MTQTPDVEILLRSYNIRQGYINIGKTWWGLFPAVTMTLELEAKLMGVIQTQFYVRDSHHGFSKNLRPWFEEHKLKGGDKIRITPIEDNKKYRLEILKE